MDSNDTGLRRQGRAIVSVILLCVFSNFAHADLWQTAIIRDGSNPCMPASSIDYTALTHIIHFSVVPNAGRHAQ